LKMRRMEGWQLGRFCVCIVTASWPLPNKRYKKKTHLMINGNVTQNLPVPWL
jgi:hypothetical protein